MCTRRFVIAAVISVLALPALAAAQGRAVPRGADTCRTRTSGRRRPGGCAPQHVPAPVLPVLSESLSVLRLPSLLRVPVLRVSGLRYGYPGWSFSLYYGYPWYAGHTASAWASDTVTRTTAMAIPATRATRQHRYDGGVRLVVPQRNAEVYVDGYYAGVVNDFDGTFQQVNLEPGPHRIEVRGQGSTPLSFDVNVQPGQTVTYRAPAPREAQP